MRNKDRRRLSHGSARARRRRKRDRSWTETSQMIDRERRAGNEHWWPVNGEGTPTDDAESGEPEMPMPD